MRIRPSSLVLAVVIAAPVAWYFAIQTCPRSHEAAAAQSSSAAPEKGPASAHKPLTLTDDPTTIKVEAGEHTAPSLINQWADAKGLIPDIDPQVRQIKIHFKDASVLTRDSFRDMLDYHDVVFVTGRGNTFHALHRRNLAQKAGPPWDTIEGDEPVDPDRLVTRTIDIQSGAGNSIFATIRGLLTRDTNRIGNILYIQGPEQIVIVDFARNVRYYETVIGRLDVASPDRPKRACLEVYEIAADEWDDLREANPRVQLAALRGDATRLDVLDVDLRQGFEATRNMTLPSGAGDISLTVAPQAAPFGVKTLEAALTIRPGVRGERTLTFPIPVVNQAGPTPWIQACAAGGDTLTCVVLAVEPR